MRRRALAVVVALLLFAAGAWELGQGIWIHAKAQLAQHLLQRAWERTLRGEAGAKPWPWADTSPVARLKVPAHGVDLIVLAGVSGRTLAFGPGYASEGVAVGAPGTGIVSGHRDTHFRFLQEVRSGEEIILEAPGRAPVRFRVEALSVVDSRTALIRSDPSSTSLALITCFPFDALRPGGPLRYVVSARAPAPQASARPGAP